MGLNTCCDLVKVGSEPKVLDGAQSMNFRTGVKPALTRDRSGSISLVGCLHLRRATTKHSAELLCERKEPFAFL